MARKKREASAGAQAPWLNTFADLMNLLLCFFVLLFAMSDVSSAKFEQISISMSNSFGVFDAGGSSIGQGNLINSGMSQLNNLDQYFNTMGEKSQKTKVDNEGTYDPTTKENTEDVPNDSQSMDSQDISEAMEKLQQKMAEVSETMYNKVSDLTQQYNLGDYVELTIDPEFQFVQLTLKGSVLYDSGEAVIKEEAKPILSKIGELLAKFNGYTVEVIGHTDNVPMNSSTYKDNNWLSSARALNAAEYLIQEKMLDPAMIKYSGRGEYEPITSNATAEGRSKNRRIEIKIYNEYSGR